MKRFLIISLIFLAGCTPAQVIEEPIPETLQGDLIEQEVSPDDELQIVERLLPSGFIEIGDRDAEVVLMLFTEHHCRYCKEFYRDQFPLLHEDFIEQGKVRLQISILPLQKYIHSEQAAMGMICAATQGKGIPMHELLFRLGAKNRDVLLKQAATLELDLEIFEQCLDSPDTARTLERQKSLARSFDVDLVPTFFLNGKKSIGLPYYADLKGMLEQTISDRVQ